MKRFNKWIKCVVSATPILLAGAIAEPVLAKNDTHFDPVGSIRDARFVAPPKEDDFKMALQIVLQRMQNSYAQAVKEPLHIHVLDVNTPVERNFFERSNEIKKGRFDPHTVLGLNYDGYAKFNDKRIAACVVQYDSQRRMELLVGYERSQIFNKQEILYYLASHEFGHCMAFHQPQINGKPHFSAKEHEFMADKISVAFFHVNGKPESAEKVIKFNQTLVSGHLHSHPDKLSRWYENLKRHLHGKDPQVEAPTMAHLYWLADSISHL